MKKFSVISAFMLFFAAIGFTSCDTEPVDPLLVNNGGEQPGPAMFKADFNGTTYVADQATAAVNAGLISVTGIKMPSGESISLVVPGTTTGTYDLADGGSLSYHSSLTATYFYINVDPSLEEDPNGSITITSINTANHTISGTFNFVGYRNDVEEDAPSITFTNGSFQNVPYTGNVGPQPTDSLFKVNIDGTLYTADDAQAAIGDGLINVAGLRGSNGEYVAVVVNGTSEGTYTEEAIMSYSASDNDDNVYSNLFSTSPGSVTISEIDTVNHTISGTFSFTGINDADDEKVFTNGVFENVPYTTEDVSTDELEATIDGNFVDYIDSVVVTWVESGPNANIGIQGFGNDHEIRLSISNSLIPGTYPIAGDLSGDVKAYYTDAEDNEYSGSLGSLTITSKANGRIAGTFLYTVKNDAGEVIHEVTAGAFDVEYDF